MTPVNNFIPGFLLTFAPLNLNHSPDLGCVVAQRIMAYSSAFTLATWWAQACRDVAEFRSS